MCSIVLNSTPSHFVNSGGRQGGGHPGVMLEGCLREVGEERAGGGIPEGMGAGRKLIGNKYSQTSH